MSCAFCHLGLWNERVVWEYLVVVLYISIEEYDMDGTVSVTVSVILSKNSRWFDNGPAIQPSHAGLSFSIPSCTSFGRSAIHEC